MGIPEHALWNELLRSERIQRNWRQRDVAEQLGTSPVTITRWEQGYQYPNSYFRGQLCALFGKSPQELGFVSENTSTNIDKDNEEEALEKTLFSTAFPVTWNIPYPRNPFFTDREEILQQMHEQFFQADEVGTTRFWAISGLGGIGKTQLVVEYAYRYAREYETVFWVMAAERETLLSSFAALSELLHLPERDEAGQLKRVNAVKGWLQRHSHWLLILDNVDDLALLPDLLSLGRYGHVLITTRSRALGGLANCMEVPPMGQAGGTLFLLRRAGLLSPHASLKQARSADLADAEQLWQELAGLPLALDQAGAFLEETQCDFSDYLHLLQTQRIALLDRRGGVLLDHPESVLTTFTLAIQTAARQHPAVVDFLRVCALLHPEAIPEELFRQGASHLNQNLAAICGNLLEWNKLLARLSAYSLLHRQPGERTLSIHRLVQTVLLETMTEAERDLWIQSVIVALNAVFPKSEHATWRTCERLLPHVLTTTMHSQAEKDTSLELASLLFKAARYLHDHARYKQSELFYLQSLHIRQQILGNNHLDVAQSLNALAEQYHQQRKDDQARQLYLQVLAIREQILGAEHPDLAGSLYGLANVYNGLDDYAQAEPLYRRAIDIRESNQGPEHPDLAPPLDGLAIIFAKQEDFVRAEPLFERALAIREHALGSEHPDMAASLHNLAVLYTDQGKYEQAEPLYLRALHIWESTRGADHFYLTNPLTGLAALYADEGKYEQAEPLYLRALHIYEQVLGPGHFNLVSTLKGLADLYVALGKYGQAESFYQRALRIYEQEPEHIEQAEILTGLASCYVAWERPQEAVPLYQRALLMQERKSGMSHPTTRETRRRLLALLSTLDRCEEAVLLEKEIVDDIEAEAGPDTVTKKG